MRGLIFTACVLLLLNSASAHFTRQSIQHQLPYSANALQHEATLSDAKAAEDEAEIWLTPSFVDEKETTAPSPSYVEMLAAGMKQPMLTGQPTPSSDVRFKEARKGKGIKEWWAKLKASLGGGSDNSTTENVTTVDSTTTTTTSAVSTGSTASVKGVNAAAALKKNDDDPNILQRAYNTVSNAVSPNTTDSEVNGTVAVNSSAVASAFRASASMTRTLKRQTEDNSTLIKNDSALASAFSTSMTHVWKRQIGDNANLTRNDTDLAAASFLEEEDAMIMALKLSGKRNVFDWLKKVKANFLDIFKSHQASANMAHANATMNATLGNVTTSTSVNVDGPSKPEEPAKQPEQPAKPEAPATVETTTTVVTARVAAAPAATARLVVVPAAHAQAATTSTPPVAHKQ